MKRVLNHRLIDWTWLAGVALGYAVLAKVALTFFAKNSVVSLVWPSSGFALAALLIGGKNYWPAILIGAFAGNMAAGSLPWVSFCIGFGNTLEALTSFWLLERTKRFDINLAQQSNFMWLGVAAALGSSVAAINGVAVLFMSGKLEASSILQNLLEWWQGDALGIVLVTPLILVWRRPPHGWLSRGRLLETIACFGLAFLAGQIIFLGWFSEIFGATARGYWVFLFVAWGAMRFGLHGTMLILVMTALQMLIGMVLQVGGYTTNQAPVGLLNFWLYMLVLTSVGISLALYIDKLRLAEAKITQGDDLFNKLSKRLPGVIYQFRLYPDGRSCFPYASEAIQEIYEVTPEQVREDASKVFAILHPDDYDGIVASIQESARTLNLWQHEYRVVLPKQGVRWRLGESQPEMLEDGSVLWHGFITDITSRKESEERIQRLTKLYKALSETNQAIVRMEQQAELFPLACRCAVEFGGMKLAWIGQLEEASGLIIPVASYGEWQGCLDNMLVSSRADVPEGLSTTGTALRQNRAIIVNDFLNSPKTKLWHENAMDLGWASAAAFPIQRAGRPFAVLTVCHANTNAFDQESIALLEEMSKDISFALDNFDRETQRVSAEESLRLAASVYEVSSEAMTVTDAHGVILTVNPAYTKITGYLPEEVIGKSFTILSSGRHEETFYKIMWDQLIATGQWQGEIWDKRKNGEVFAAWHNINTIFNKDGSVYRRVLLFSDATEWKKTENLIWRQANFDPLTELPNRQMFLDRLGQELKKAERSATTLALMFIDLDRFKEVNDTLGHDMGDILLKEAAQRLKACVRETDTVARLGGDEFTIILSETKSFNVIERVALDILGKLAEPFYLGDEVVYISASVGITEYPDDAADIETLFKNADQAMYAAKKLGRNRYHYFTQAMQEAAQTRMYLASELRTARVNNQFKLVYQPIVELASNAIYKAEALIRWEHPQRGLINPAEFIPIAEDTGLIIDIGEWVFREAAKQVSLWRENYYPEFQISINKSPAQFNNENQAYPAWTDQLKQLGLSGQSIVVEITEGMLMDAKDVINTKLLAFRDAGIQVSLDDFGTGYSSLSYLKKFDIDYLKIDISFVRNLGRDNDDLALCKAIIMMAHTLGIKVIAEGIETMEQRDLLLAAGCDYGQGYLFSRPVPANEFEKLLS